MSRFEHLAEVAATNVVEALWSEISEAVQRRRVNAVWWYTFHSTMLNQLPRWRWAARLVHSNGKKRAWAAIQANKCLSGACARLPR